jgi:hypothetical protein
MMAGDNMAGDIMDNVTTQNTARPGRNDACGCGSGRKYKHCCLAKDEKADAAARAAAAKEPDAPASEEEPSAAPRAAKPKTAQPWKTGSSTRGFVPRSRTPRKVGGG